MSQAWWDEGWHEFNTFAVRMAALMAFDQEIMEQRRRALVRLGPSVEVKIMGGQVLALYEFSDGAPVYVPPVPEGWYD